MSSPAPPLGDRQALFEQARERLSAALERALRDALPLVASDLERAGEVEPAQARRQALYAAAALLRIEARVRIGAAAASWRRLVSERLDLLRRPDERDRVLALVEEDELRLQIAGGQLAAAVRQAAGGGYAQCAERVRNLASGLWADDDLNPLGARSLSVAALGAFTQLGEEPVVRHLLARTLLARLPAPLAAPYEELNRWLREQGLAASPPPVPGPVGATPPAAGAAEAGGAPEEPASGAGTAPTPQRPFEATAQSADAARALGSSPFAAGSPAAPLGVVPTLQPVVEIERDAVAFAHSIGALPYSREARAAFFGNVRARVRAAGAPPAQVSVIELVAAMFDYVVDDRRVPEAAKPLIWRLQQPAVALSLLDPAYLGDEPRSLRRLVENVGAIINAFSEDIARGSELHRRLDTVVRAVEIVAGALQTRSAVMARQVEHEYSRAARSVTQLIERVVQERTSLEATPGRRNRRDYRRRPDRAREQEVTRRLEELLGERLERHHVPDSVREFVLNVWLRHLRTAILRDGEESAEFKVALEVVDELLWSLDGSRERISRRELAQKIPPLIRLLTQGMREIGARDEEFKPFFDELFLIHLRRMQRKPGRSGGGTRTLPGPATRPGPAGGEAPLPDRPAPAGRRTLIERASAAGQGSPAQPVAGPTRPAASSTQPVAGPQPTVAPAGEPQPTAAEAAPAGEPVDHGDGAERKLLEVLSSLDLADLPAEPRPLAMDADRALGTLRRGDWIALAGRDGASQYAKVAWINARRTVVLMVRHPDRRALSLRAAELRERFEHGRAARIA